MKYNIHKNDTIPAYLQLYKQVREDIITGIYPYGTKLPSKRLIAAETGIRVFALDMAMSGESYFEAMYRNIDTVKEAMG